MKTKLACAVVGLALLAGLTQTARAAVNFTITPSTVSNTYSGIITFQVTGLTNNGDTVVVQKFLDANTNGVIDAGDLLWQQFTLTDGTNFVIGGVTNINVPGDTDGTANGTITAKLYLQPDFAQTITGNYLFKLSSPGGHFAPVTNSFTVTNFAYAQKFTGTVAVPDAVVILFDGSNQNLNTVGGVVANNAGLYSIPAPAGTYLLAAFKTNFVADTTAAANLVLGTGVTFNTNLNLIAATQSISGQVVDANNSSIGLPGLILPVETQNGLLGIGFTDTNGNFTVRVTADQWQIQGDSAAVALHGYLELQNGPVVDTTTGSVAGVNSQLPRATALFYGTVKDSLGNPLSGPVAVEAIDYNGLYVADGFTDTNGYYVTGALGGLGAGDPWQVQVDNSSSYPNYIFSQPAFDENGNGTNINAGQTVLANITALLATNHISGNVSANGTNIVGVGVYAYATVGGVDYSTYADADNNGDYSFNVANGSWHVGVNQNGGDDSLDGILGGGNYQPPDEQSVTINNDNGMADFTVQTCDGVQIITTSPLPPAQQGNYYSIQLEAASCNNNFTWSVNDPADFPPGLTLYSGGPINGTPTTNGLFNFSIHVDDGSGHAADTNLSLTVAPMASPLVITNISLPNGNVGVGYSAQLGATGGQSPYTWAPVSGNPPPGLLLNTNGLISGTPTTNGLFSFIVQTTDFNSTITNKVFGIIVNPKPVLSLANWLTNQFRMQLSGGSNQNYTVQVSTNLGAGNWATLLITNNPATNSYYLTDPNATNKQRFYRILIGP